MNSGAFPDKVAILEATGRIRPYIHRTPILTSKTLNALSKARLLFKCENLQKTGSFKIRGACNGVFSLDEETVKNGVATHSSGNHAQALALAAQMRNIPAYIVMPDTSAKPKVAAVHNYGGIITFCEPTLHAREETLKIFLQKHNATEVHPYNDYKTICGQATAAMELIEDAGCKLDIIMAPVGGGGLISGTALAARYFSPHTKVIAAEPEKANDAFLSFRAGYIIPAPEKPQTIADGLLTSLGSTTFPVIMQYVHDIITVDEDAIVKAMQLIWERMKLVIEPSAAVTVAALLSKTSMFEGKNIGIILCGGNVDLHNLPW